MYSLSICILLTYAVLEQNGVTGFLVPYSSSDIRIGTTSASSLYLSSLPSPEESAKAMQEYMAKAHEEKLRALKDLGDKKDTEIAELKSQLNNARGGTQSTGIELANTSDDIEELKKQLLQYQQFMSKYIISAQEDKYRAVKEAENKYKQKLLALSPSSSTPASTSSATTVPATISLSESSKLYQDRSAKVAAAGTKSRWGDAEVQKSKSVASAAPAPSVVNVLEKVAPSRPVIEASPQIIAADHGIRRDGDLSLAERVILGSKASEGKPQSSSSPASSLANVSSNYVKRNQKLINAGKANKSNRWGDQEIVRVSSWMEQVPQASTPSVVVRGEVDSVSVNIGAKILAL